MHIVEPPLPGASSPFLHKDRVSLTPEADVHAGCGIDSEMPWQTNDTFAEYHGPQCEKRVLGTEKVDLF